MKACELYPSIYPTDALIAEAKAAIGHRCDGPLTMFVLIARATEFAAKDKRELAHRAAAEALTELLEEHGYVTGSK